MTYSFVRELAADGAPVTATYWAHKIARQHYYRWPACADTDAKDIVASSLLGLCAIRISMDGEAMQAWAHD